MSFRTAGQLATTIKMACKMDIADLGDEKDQDFFIFQWINYFMYERAKKIRKIETSDAIEITDDGYVMFTKNSNPIDNMYEPNLMLDENNKSVPIRTSFDSTRAGWYREDAFSPIHVVGLEGFYRLKFIRYPNPVTLDTDTPEMPPAMYGECIAWVAGKIKYSKNWYEESKAMLQDAESVRLAGVKAARSAMGTNSQKPGEDDAVLG